MVSNYELSPADATAISWSGNRGVGVSGTVYSIWEIFRSEGRSVLCAGLEGSPPGAYLAAVPLHSDGSADRVLLEMMSGREDLIVASVGDALETSDPELPGRATVALRIKVHTLDQQISQALVRGPESECDILEMEAERDRWHRIEGKVSCWEAIGQCRAP